MHYICERLIKLQNRVSNFRIIDRPAVIEARQDNLNFKKKTGLDLFKTLSRT